MTMPFFIIVIIQMLTDFFQSLQLSSQMRSLIICVPLRRRKSSRDINAKY